MDNSGDYICVVMGLDLVCDCHCSIQQKDTLSLDKINLKHIYWFQSKKKKEYFQLVLTIFLHFFLTKLFPTKQ